MIHVCLVNRGGAPHVSSSPNASEHLPHLTTECQPQMVVNLSKKMVHLFHGEGEAI